MKNFEINDRVIKLISMYAESNGHAFAKMLGLERADNIYNIQKKKYNPSQDTINLILSKLPQVNANWLLAGEGEMLKGSSSPKSIQQEKLDKEGTELLEEYQRLFKEFEALKEELELKDQEIQLKDKLLKLYKDKNK